MAYEETLKAVITAEDRATDVIRGINERIEHLTAPLRRVGHGFAELAEHSGLTSLRERFGELTERAGEFGERIGEIVGPLAALGGLFSLAGIAEGLKSSAEFDEQIELTSKATGLAAQELTGWSYAAKLANVDQERLNRGIEYFNRQIAEAARGKDKDVEEILGRLGFQNAPGHLVGTSEGLQAISKSVQQLTSSGQIQLATDLLSKLFGARSGAELLPIFQQGPEKLAEQFAEAQKHGIVQTKEQVEVGAQFAEAYKQMDASVQGLFLSISDKLYPIMSPLLNKMTDWIDANRKWIATNIGDAVKRVAEALESADWSGPATALRLIGEGAIWVTQHLGLVTDAFYVLAAVKLGGLVTSIASIGAALITPIGLVAVLAAGALLVYENWSTIWPEMGRLAKDQWNSIKATAGATADWITQRWHDFKDWTADLWHGIGDMAHQAWQRIGDDFAAMWQRIEDLIPDWARRAAGWAVGVGGQIGESIREHFGGGSGPAWSGGPLTGQRAEIARQLVQHAEAAGLDRPHALAMVGNALVESGLNPQALGDNGTSLGLFQEHAERMAAMQAALGNRISDPLAQLDYAIAEQRRNAPGWFQQTGSVAELTNSWESSFERPAHPGDRSEAANRIAEAISNASDKMAANAGVATPSPLVAGGALATPLYGPTGPQSAMRGRIDVNVNHNNPPTGTTLDLATDSDRDLDMNLGQAFAY